MSTLLARYAESTGKTVNFAYPHAWRYRDYVIAAFNADKPYDQFVREQLAGDELDNVTPETLIATGFYRVGPIDDVIPATESDDWKQLTGGRDGSLDELAA